MAQQKPYDTTVARMAGNIAAGLITLGMDTIALEEVRHTSVWMATSIVETLMKRAASVISVDPAREEV